MAKAIRILEVPIYLLVLAMGCYEVGAPGTAIFLDSPASTSELTYKLQGKIRATTLYVGRTVFDTDNDNASRHTSSITVMEIAG